MKRPHFEKLCDYADVHGWWIELHADKLVLRTKKSKEEKSKIVGVERIKASGLDVAAQRLLAIVAVRDLEQ